MTRIFRSNITRVNEDTIQFTVLHLGTNREQIVHMALSNPLVMDRVMECYPFPCEEIDYGVHGEKFTDAQLLETLKCIVASCASQVPGTPEYERIEQMGREIAAEEKEQRQKNKKKK